MCLVLGPPAVGKTLLLKRLQCIFEVHRHHCASACSTKGNYMELEEAPPTMPTVGTNLVNIVTGKKSEVVLRELGGCMAPVWPTYFKDCSAVLFVIDASNRHQVSAACIQLLDLLSNSALKSTPVLIILNKCDLPNIMNRVEMESIFRLTDIVRHSPQTVRVIECSARDGTGLAHIVQWIQQNTHF